MSRRDAMTREDVHVVFGVLAHDVAVTAGLR